MNDGAFVHYDDRYHRTTALHKCKLFTVKALARDHASQQLRRDVASGLFR